MAAVLSFFCPALTVISTSLVYTAAYTLGVEILGGIIQGTIVKQYAVLSTPCSVAPYDAKTNRYLTYTGDAYKVRFTDGSYSSEYYYDGYLHWWSYDVALWMFGDFWGYPYPGVNSFTFY